MILQYTQNKKKYLEINKNNIVLDKETQKFIDSIKGPPIYKLTPQLARDVLNKIQQESSNACIHQSSNVANACNACTCTDIQDIPINFENSNFTIRIVKPKKQNRKLPIVLYYHGGGWVMGNVHTHDRLIRELSYGADVAIAFVEYTNSPEATYQTIIKQCYHALTFIHENSERYDLDNTKMAIMGDSVGGNLSIVTLISSIKQNGPKILYQILLYPVVDAKMDTPSYAKFKNGPWLTANAMKWFWNSYAPRTSKNSEGDRLNYLLSPINASNEQLKNIPPTLIITDENDVLRDEGENFAKKLIIAGVDVTALRILGTIHDFMMLNPLANTSATREGINIAINFLKKLN